MGDVFSLNVWWLRQLLFQLRWRKFFEGHSTKLEDRRFDRGLAFRPHEQARVVQRVHLAAPTLRASVPLVQRQMSKGPAIPRDSSNTIQNKNAMNFGFTTLEGLTLCLSGRGTARPDVLEIDVASYFLSAFTRSDRQSVLLGTGDRPILGSRA